MIPVILESPYAGDIQSNEEYAYKCCLDCLSRGESPYASHLFFTQFLDDNVPEEREQGIQAGFAWRTVAKKTVVYTDRGISKGMEYGIEHSEKLGIEIEYRSIENA
jgi:hypothetical protein